MSDSVQGNKKFTVIAWILLLVGMVIAADGLIQLMAGNSERMGQASFGGFLMMASTPFYVLGRRQPKLDATAPEAAE